MDSLTVKVVVAMAVLPAHLDAAIDLGGWSQMAKEQLESMGES